MNVEAKLPEYISINEKAVRFKIFRKEWTNSCSTMAEHKPPDPEVLGLNSANATHSFSLLPFLSFIWRVFLIRSLEEINLSPGSLVALVIRRVVHSRQVVALNAAS